MKRFTWCLILLIILPFVFYADTIQILAPQEDEVLYLGTSFEIMWETQTIGNTFFLFLYLENEEVGIIQDNIPGDERRCPWKVGEYQGGMAKPADNYRILVRMYTPDGPIERKSSTFCIYKESL